MQSSSHLVRIDLVEGTERGKTEQVEVWRQQNDEQVIRKRDQARQKWEEKQALREKEAFSGQVPRSPEFTARTQIESSHQRGLAVIVTLSRAENLEKREPGRPGPVPVLWFGAGLEN